MIQTVMLGPHDPMPSGPGRHVVVLRRFKEDDPDGTAVQIILTGSLEETTHPRRPDGTPMGFEEAIEAARKVAESEGIRRIFVVDRMQGKRESDILSHEGDHSVHGAALVDTDEEDGERGADMRDVTHRSS